MKTITEKAYGIIPYTRVGSEIHFLVIHQKTGHDGQSYWVFPKGHPEVDESPEEAARRELKEETNLEIDELDQTKQVSVSYTFEKSGNQIEKTSTFFIAEVKSQDQLKLQAEEIIVAEWLPYQEARSKLTYANTKKLLDQAVKIINQR